MPDNPQVVIVTQSAVFTRVVPRVLDYPVDWDLRIAATVAEAERYYQTRPTILMVDLRTGGDGLSHLLRGLVNNRIPPTLLTGEPWHVPPWIREQLCNKLIFITYPINPAKINAALKGIDRPTGRIPAGRFERTRTRRRITVRSTRTRPNRPGWMSCSTWTRPQINRPRRPIKWTAGRPWRPIRPICWWPSWKNF